MSKAVLISIQPKWCELIASGKKTIEVRKSRPKLETPFKVYIYCTLQGSNEFFKNTLNGNISKWNKGNWGFKKGKVIGEFVCDNFVLDKTFGHDPLFNGAACFSEIDAAVYSLNNPMYGWHISDLKIYDKPKELSEFWKPCIYPKMPYCPTCPVGYEYISETEEEFYVCDGECNTEWICQNYLKKPPQSWCYVEESEDNV